MARILLIEPDRIMAVNFKKVLKRAGHTVDWHVDAQTAIDSTDQVLPNIIVLDLFIAGHSGVEFLYEFRSYPEWQDVPIIIYSSVSAQDIQLEGLGFSQLGITAYRYKSVTAISELARSIDQVLP